MNSCLYECSVMHLRVKPKRHRLHHKIFMFYLDLAEIDEVAATNRWIRHNRPGLYSFYDRDHLPLGAASVRENLLLFLRSRGMEAPVGKIMMLAHLRVLGYVFNPLTVYFCFTPDGEPLCSVPEIGNTFGEIKPYHLAPATFREGAYRDEQKKFYYISPFSRPDLALDFQFKIPGERLDVRVDDVSDGEKILYASLTGEKKALTEKSLFLMTLRYPLVTLKVISLIHWHAILLFFKGVPFYMKQTDAHLQKEVLRAWGKH